MTGQTRRAVSRAVCLFALCWAAPGYASPLSWSALTVYTGTDADPNPSISANGVDLIAAGFCAATEVDPSVVGYSSIVKFELSPSYLTGFEGISINASPSLSGTRPLAMVVPGDITINAPWSQCGANGVTSSGVYQGLTGGPGGVCGGYKGGDSWPGSGLPGDGPGGGGGGNPSGAGGSLVSSGGAGDGSSANVATGFPPHPGKSADPVSDLWAGSGGGGSGATWSLPKYRGSGAGGAGAVGFFCSVDSGSIVVANSITLGGGNGGSGSKGGGGGGSGGTIILMSGDQGSVTLAGQLSADGGAGGYLAGGGAGGEIAVYYGTVLNDFATPTVDGGTGYNDGDAGHYYTEALYIPIPGDANLDGTVNLSDFTILKAHFGQSPADWPDGDFNDDDTVNLSDFTILKAHFGESKSAATALPEPASLSLLALGAMMTLKRKRK